MIRIKENMEWNPELPIEMQTQEAQEWYYEEICPLLCLRKERREEGMVVPEWDQLGRPFKWLVEKDEFILQVERIYRNASDWGIDKDVITVKEKEG
ncbi:MAG: hypothetical protein LUG18_15285 [Candidatus Azobacteroides sp.]|nr:hypothetical protein [Candidatus Azobacteroides sp.]